MSKVVILVPRRADHARRDALWAWCSQNWHYPVVEGASPDGPFNRSAAVNDAARNAGDWDIAVIIDADVVVPAAQLETGVELAKATDKAVLPYSHWCLVNQRDSDAILRTGTLPTSARGTNARSNRWSGCVIVPREAWERVSGFDERFVGWGGEDVAFAVSLLATVGAIRVPGNLYHLWHPASSEKTKTDEYVRNWMLEHRYVAALDATGQDGTTLFDDPPNYLDRRAMVRLEASWSHGRMLADWSGWWPSIDELIARAPLPSRERRIVAVVHTDGRRDMIARSIPSFEARVRGPVARRVIWDDSGDVEYQAWLRARFPAFEVVGHDRRLGYTESMRQLWKLLAKAPEEYVFRIEDDFEFERDVDLDELATVLEARPYLRQMALLRGPWYEEERAAGGIVQVKPDDFTIVSEGDRAWLEHRTWWTANPSLFPTSLVSAFPWPRSNHSEAAYSRMVRADRRARMAYWGDGTPWITHIGAERVGTGY